MKEIKGFTLAEVLITLVIIGIIAAITVPVVMANHRKTETSSKLKKFYATMSNAIKLAENEEGIPSYDWDFSLDGKEFFEKYLKKHVVTGEVEDTDSQRYRNGNWLYFDVKFNDGAIMGFDWWGSDNGRIMMFIVDVNGDKGPNESGRDVFDFAITNNKQFGGILFPFGCSSQDPVENKKCSRQEMLDYCKEVKHSCSELIMNDGWEIKDDYPYKI